MSGHGVHVHGAHEHAVEHHAQSPGLGQTVAIFSAVLATVGAIVSFFGGDTQNDAILYKNNAVYERAEASDAWNYYQAKSTKQNLAELAAAINTDPKKVEFYKSEAKRYEAEKEGIRKTAEGHENRAKSWNEMSAKALHPHHFLSISMTLLQIAIALASITVLVQKRWLLYGASLSALAGAILAIVAYVA